MSFRLHIEDDYVNKDVFSIKTLVLVQAKTLLSRLVVFN